MFCHSKLVQKDKNTGRAREFVIADGTSRDSCEVWVTIVAPYIAVTILALVLDMPIANLILSNCLTVLTQPQVMGER